MSQLTIAVAGGFAGVIGVMIAQAAMDHGRDRRRLYRAAGAPGIEAAAIARAVGGRDLARYGISGICKMRAVPWGAYDGILSSGVLSRFDLQAQEMLCRFYWHVSIGDNRGIESMIGQVIATVGQVARENAPGLRAALGGAPSGG